MAAPVDRMTPPAQAAVASIDNMGNGSVAGEQEARPDGVETREKRSRDRYGRERGPRGDRAEQGDRQERPARDVQPVVEESAEEPRRSYFATSTEAPATMTVAPAAAPVAAAAPVVVPVAFAPVSTPTAPAPVPAPVIAKPVAAPVAATTGMPKLQPFALPLAELAQVAQSSGLSWVNSDAEKIAAVQAAIAAEPKPVRVPRVRPAAVQVDASPLVLVETKRDLRNMTLPFEEKDAQ
jgi:ribonuclease E